MNFVIKEILVQSDLVSVLIKCNYFQLKINIYKTCTNTCIYIYIKVLQIQCKYIIQ